MSTARLRRALLIGVLLALLLVVRVCWPHERLLLDHAVNVVAIDDWDEYRAHKKAAFGHKWLSDQAVLFAREEAKANEDAKNRYYIYDTRSRSIAPAAKYEKAFRMIEPSYGVEFSPNRQWLYAEHSNGDGLDVIKWDGSRKYTFKEKGYPLFWMSDSIYANSVSAEDYSNEGETEHACLRLRSVTDGRILKDIRYPKEDVCKSGHILYCTDHFVTLRKASEEGKHPVLLEVTSTGMGLKNYPIRKQTFVLAFPYQQNMDDLEFKLSPDGSKIAYRCVLTELSPLLAMMHRLYPHFDLKPQSKVALWLSDADGKHLHELGHINLEKEKDYLDTFLDFEWLPSGKRIAFRYKERLLTVPAD